MHSLHIFRSDHALAAKAAPTGAVAAPDIADGHRVSKGRENPPEEAVSASTDTDEPLALSAVSAVA